jgi:DNA-binding transcriptional MocR family regulator
VLSLQVSSAQQYNVSAKGYAPLQRWAEDYIAQMHAPPSPHDVLITTGSNHAVDVSHL